MPGWLPAWMFHFSQWLDQTSFGQVMRESLYLFPIVETLHVFGIVSLVSSAFLLDLRLFGVGPMRDEPVDKLARWILPWVLAGFTVQVVTGVLMFSAEATRSAVNSFFWYKMFLLLGVGINALVFHTTVFCRSERGTTLMSLRSGREFTARFRSSCGWGLSRWGAGSRFT